MIEKHREVKIKKKKKKWEQTRMYENASNCIQVIKLSHNIYVLRTHTNINTSEHDLKSD